VLVQGSPAGFQYVAGCKQSIEMVLQELKINLWTNFYVLSDKAITQ